MINFSKWLDEELSRAGPVSIRKADDSGGGFYQREYVDGDTTTVQISNGGTPIAKSLGEIDINAICQAVLSAIDIDEIVATVRKRLDAEYVELDVSAIVAEALESL